MTEKGKKGLLCHGYTYRLADTYRQPVHFRCTKKEGKARLSTDLDKQDVQKTGGEHDQPSLYKYEKEMHTMRTSLKRNSNEDPNDRPSVLVCKIVASLSSIAATEVDNLCRQVRNNRLKQGPNVQQ